MGQSASQPAGKAAAAVSRRQYPSTSSILNSATSTSNSPSTTTQSKTPNQPGAAAEATPASNYRSSQVRPSPSEAPPSSTRSAHIDLDGRDPQFGSALRELMTRPATGSSTRPDSSTQPTTTFPTSSHPPEAQAPGPGKNIFPTSSPSMNPQLVIVQARQRIGERYDHETQNLGRASSGGRTLVGAKDIREILRMSDDGGKSAGEIERQFRLKPGVLDQVVARGVFANT